MILGGGMRPRVAQTVGCLGKSPAMETARAGATTLAVSSPIAGDRRVSPCAPVAGHVFSYRSGPAVLPLRPDQTLPCGRGDLGGASATREQTAQLRRQVSNPTRGRTSPDHQATPGQSSAAQTGGPSNAPVRIGGPPVLAT